MFMVSYDYVTIEFTTTVCEKPFNHKSMIEMTSERTAYRHWYNQKE